MNILQTAASTLMMLIASVTLGVIGFFHHPSQMRIQSVGLQPIASTTQATTSPQATISIQNTPTQTITTTQPSTSPESNAQKTTIVEAKQIASTPPAQPSNEGILLILSEMGAQASSAGTPTFNEGGYSIEIPPGFIYLRPMPNYEMWHSENADELITVQWDTDSPSSQLRRLEDTQFQYAELAKSRPAMSPVTISHPTIAGAATSSVMFEKPTYPAGAYNKTLFVTGNDGTIYQVTGLSSSPASKASVEQIMASFALAL